METIVLAIGVVILLSVILAITDLEGRISDLFGSSDAELSPKKHIQPAQAIPSPECVFECRSIIIIEPEASYIHLRMAKGTREIIDLGVKLAPGIVHEIKRCLAA